MAGGFVCMFYSLLYDHSLETLNMGPVDMPAQLVKRGFGQIRCYSSEL